MNEEKSESLLTTNQDETQCCSPGCNCASTGPRKIWKVIICLVVIFAAAIVLAQSVLRKADSESSQGEAVYAATMLAPSPVVVPAAVEPVVKMETEVTPVQIKSPLWGDQLGSLAALNEVALQNNAVFVYLPEKNRGADVNMKQQIEIAAGKAELQGVKMALFTLDNSSQDYATVTSQVPAPCVIAMYKGGGMTVASQITESILFQALVAASRPSSSCCAPGSSTVCP